MNKISGFTLIEILTAVIIIGILATIGISSYAVNMEKARAAEAQELLLKAYTGYQRLLVHDEAVTGLTWVKLGLPANPNAASRYFDYTLDTDTLIVAAARKTDANKNMTVSLTTGVLTKTAPY